MGNDNSRPSRTSVGSSQASTNRRASDATHSPSKGSSPQDFLTPVNKRLSIGSSKSLFSEMDIHKDGKLTKQEVSEYVKKQVEKNDWTEDDQDEMEDMIYARFERAAGDSGAQEITKDQFLEEMQRTPKTSFVLNGAKVPKLGETSSAGSQAVKAGERSSIDSQAPKLGEQSPASSQGLRAGERSSDSPPPRADSPPRAEPGAARSATNSNENASGSDKPPSSSEQTSDKNQSSSENTSDTHVLSDKNSSSESSRAYVPGAVEARAGEEQKVGEHVKRNGEVSDDQKSAHSESTSKTKFSEVSAEQLPALGGPNHAQERESFGVNDRPHLVGESGYDDASLPALANHESQSLPKLPPTPTDPKQIQVPDTLTENPTTEALMSQLEDERTNMFNLRVKNKELQERLVDLEARMDQEMGARLQMEKQNEEFANVTEKVNTFLQRVMQEANNESNEGENTMVNIESSRIQEVLVSLETVTKAEEPSPESLKELVDNLKRKLREGRENTPLWTKREEMNAFKDEYESQIKELEVKLEQREGFEEQLQRITEEHENQLAQHNRAFADVNAMKEEYEQQIKELESKIDQQRKVFNAELNHMSQNHTETQGQVLDRKDWKRGSKVEVYSSSMKNWFKGLIVDINNDSQGEWLEIEYTTPEGTRRKSIQRQNDKIRPFTTVAVKSVVENGWWH